MQTVDFFISNNRHHVDIIRPLVAHLSKEAAVRCRVLSLCEWRGMKSPEDAFESLGVEIVKLMPPLRSSPSAGGGTSGRGSALKNVVKKITWYLLPARKLNSVLADQRPDVVVTPNDGAYPFDQIMRLFNRRNIPIVLVQEGVKFGSTLYGRGGALAVAAWGRNSEAFFVEQGVPADQIHLTGSPRFEGLLENSYEEKATEISRKYSLGTQVLLFLSNPIDDLGLCTTEEKMNLVEQFIAEIAPLFQDAHFHLAIKLHRRESEERFQALVQKSIHRHQISVLYDEPLYPLFGIARAAVVLASTTGLEALLFKVPLGVLEIPGHGFAFDYVQSDAALGLTWEKDMSKQVSRLLESTPVPQAEAYIEQNLVSRRGATDRVVQLIKDVLQGELASQRI